MTEPFFRFLAALALAASLGLAGCAGQSEKELLALAKSSLDKKDDKAAIVHLKVALQKNPQLGEARFLLGQALAMSGDALRAAAELQRARELKYAEDDVVPALAQAVLASGDAKAVTERFSKVSLTNPKSIASLMTTLGQAYAMQGDTVRAGESVAEALKQDPKDLSARLLKLRLMASRNSLPAAIAEADAVIADEPNSAEARYLKATMLKVVGSDLDAAVRGYSEAIAIDPRHFASHRALLEIMLEKRDTAGFKAELAEFRKLWPRTPEVQVFEVQEAMFGRDLRRAQELVQELLKRLPGNPVVLELAGGVALNTGGLVAAERHLTKALQLSPNLVQARKLLAQTQLRSGDPAKAMASLEPLLAAEKPQPAALALAAEIEVVNGNVPAAEALYKRASGADPKDPVVGTALAVIQITKGNAKAGIAQLESVSAADPGIYADLALFSILQRAGDADATLRAVARLEAKLPDRPLPHELRAQVLLHRKDLAGARASFEKAAAADPSYFPAIAALAGLDVVDKKPDQARKRFEDLLAREPGQPGALLALAELRVRTGGKPEDVVNFLTEAVKSNPREPSLRLALVEQLIAGRQQRGAARLAAQEAVAAFPDDSRLLDALGRAQLAAGDLQQGISTFMKIVDIYPTRPEPLLRVADAHLFGKNYPSARQYARRALDLSPKMLAAQRALIRIAVAEKRFDEALKVARAVQSQRPTEAEGWSMEAETHVLQRKWDPAIGAFRTALDRQPNSDRAMRLHAVYVIAGRLADADRLAAIWLQTNPRDARFLLHLATGARVKKDLLGAETRYQQVIALEPQNAVALNNLARLMLDLGKPGALPLAERAQKLMPNQPTVMDTLAAALATDNQLPKAIEWQRKAVELAPNAADVRLQLAKFLVKSGDKSAARTELERLVKLGDKFAAQSEVANLLKSL